MEHEYAVVERAESAPMRSMPMIRKARRPRRPVFRVSSEHALQWEADDMNGMDSYMSRKDNMKNKYGEHSLSHDEEIDGILSDFYSGKLFSASEADYDTAAEARQTRRREEYAPEIDSRFGTGRARRVEASFDAREYELGEDEEYVAPASRMSAARQWEDEDEYDERAAARPTPMEKFGRGKKSKKKSSYQPHYIAEDEEDAEEARFERGFRDISDEAHYAEANDYFDDAEPDGKEGEEGYFPPSFSEYVASIFATLFFKIRGTAHIDSAATMSDDAEELGAEVSVSEASKYYGSYVHSMRKRVQLAAVLLGVMIYTSLGLPVPGMLNYLPVTAALCMALQFTIMLLALDIVTTGILKLARLQMGADSLAVIACIVTAIDAALVSTGKAGSAHLPLCAISSLSLVGIMLSSLLSTRALRKALRVPAIAKRIFSIVGENDIKGREITLLRTSRPATGFVRRCEEAAPDETLYAKLSPFMLLAAMVLALIVSAATHDYYDVIYIFSAILAPAIPFTALICFALPYFIGSMKLFKSGVAIAGWSGLCDVGQSSNLIVTDRDLFPEGSVSIESIRIFADEDAQKVISYAGTMIIASGCSMGKAFLDEMEQNKCTVQPMEGFEYLSGGGMKGIIDGHVVLCGSTDLMRLMNVRIPFRLVDKTTVLLAIDGVLYGIFAMKYKPVTDVKVALVNLMRSNRHPIFALRDFNLTPDMLKTTFDVATDGYDFPPYVERFKITETQPSESSKIAAVVCRESLASVTSMADTGRNMYNATRLNLLISVVSAIMGMLVVFIRMLSTGGIGLGFILMYMLLTALPILFISAGMKF